MRDPLHRLSVRYKLALMFIGVCLLAFGVGGYLVSRSARRALETEILSRLEFQCRAYAVGLDSYLGRLTSRMHDFASDGYIRGHATHILAASRAGDSARVAALRAELQRHIDVNKLPLEPAFGSLTIVSNAGAAVLRDTLEPDVQAFVRAHAGSAGTWYGGILEPVESGTSPVVLVATPLRDLIDGTVFGRLVVHVRAGSWILGALASIRSDPPPHENDVRLSLADAAGHGIEVPESWTRLARPDPASELALHGIGLRAGATTDGAEPRSYAPIRGVYTQSFPVRTNGWRIRVDLQATEILDTVSGLQSRFLGFGALLALLATSLLWFPMRYLARPLQKLKNAARRIKDGDLETRVDVESTDEIGELSQSFNAMAAALETREQDLRAKQHELRQEHDRLRTVIASMRDGLIVLDAEGGVVLSNAAARPFLDQFRDCDRTPHNVCRVGTAEPGRECADCLFGHDSGPRSCVLDIGLTSYEVHATPLDSDASGRAGRVLIVTDVTDRLQADESQIHQERLAVMGEVAAVMAHELNNPLTAISMFNQMLGTELPNDSPLRENVEVIQRNTAACKRTIRELLDYATGAPPEMAWIDVHDILEDVVRFLQPVSQRSGTEIRSRLDASHAGIAGDEVQVRQVFVNLVMNALQAIDGADGVVELRTSNDAGFLCVGVTDNGPGIPSAARDQIFRPFFTSKPRGAGTGLGLPTSRRIAELHGGGLELVESRPGRTVFRVRFRVEELAPARAGGNR